MPFINIIANLFNHKKDSYLLASKVNELYKTIPDKSNSTQIELILELKLKNFIIIWKNHKDYKKVSTIANISLLEFKPDSMNIYISLNELQKIKFGWNKKYHKQLVKLIKKHPNINELNNQEDSIIYKSINDESINETSSYELFHLNNSESNLYYDSDDSLDNNLDSNSYLQNNSELNMYKSKNETKAKQILSLYPPKEDELYQLLEESKNKYEIQLELLKSEHKIEMLKISQMR